MRKADRLSKRYFRVCSWNCASANRRGAVLEKMVYYFDVVYVYKKQGHAQIDHWCFKASQSSRGMKAVVRQ